MKDKVLIDTSVWIDILKILPCFSRFFYIPENDF